MDIVGGCSLYTELLQLNGIGWGGEQAPPCTRGWCLPQAARLLCGTALPDSSDCPLLRLWGRSGPCPPHTPSSVGNPHIHQCLTFFHDVNPGSEGTGPFPGAPLPAGAACRLGFRHPASQAVLPPPPSSLYNLAVRGSLRQHS